MEKVARWYEACLCVREKEEALKAHFLRGMGENVKINRISEHILAAETSKILQSTNTKDFM